MCYEKPGPRCSGHTRTKYQETKMELALAEKDLTEKKTALDGAKSAKAKAELQTSQNLVSAARNAHAIATKNYDASKAYRATAMEAHREAKKEYLTSAEGIQKLRDAGKDADADRFQKRRDGQLKAYKAVKSAEKIERTETTTEVPPVVAKASEVTSAVEGKPDVSGLSDSEFYELTQSTNDPQVLDAIVESRPGEFHTMYYVASNKGTGTKTLRTIAERMNPGEKHIAKHLVTHPNLPYEEKESVVRRALDDSWSAHDRNLISKEIFADPAVDPKLIGIAAKEYKVEEATVDSRLPLETISEIVDQEEYSPVYSNPSLPAKYFGSEYAEKQNKNSWSFMDNPNTTGEVLENIAPGMGNQQLLLLASQHPNTTAEISIRCTSNPDYKFRAKYAALETTNVSILRSMENSEKTATVLNAIRSNPNYKYRGF